MGDITFRSDEKVGLAAAVGLHGALVAILLMQAVRSQVTVFPDRMTVSLATEVGLESAAPDLVSESRASVAPTLSPDPAPAPAPAPAPGAAQPQPATRTPLTPPKPAIRTATNQPAPNRDRTRPDRTLPKQAATTPPKPAPKPATKAGGASRIGDDFLDGKGASTTTQETRAPAAKFGTAERAALASAITRQLRPNWSAPSGLDAEQLVSTVSWDLSPDGTLRGTPRCRTAPSSITASNRPQAELHCERAIRAVQRAAPFNLPDQFYDRWKALEWQFDRRL